VLNKKLVNFGQLMMMVSWIIYPPLVDTALF